MELENRKLEITPDESLMDEIIEALKDTTSTVGLEEFAALLALPDDQFKIFSDMVLEELQKALNEPQDKVMLLESLRRQNVQIEDIEEFRTQLIKEIDSNIGEKISPEKVDFLKRAMNEVMDVMADSYGVAGSIVTVPVELEEDAHLPRYANEGDACVDLYSMEDYIIDPGQTVLVKTGLKVAVPKGYALLIHPRSGQSLKTKLRICNAVGVVDSGYRDEVGVILENVEPKIKDIAFNEIGNGSTLIVKSVEYGQSYTIEKGQRVAQARLVKVPTINWLEVENIKTIKGDRNGGFGSSGKF